MCSRRFVVREAALHEFDDIRKFYEKYPDPHVMLRSEDAVKHAIREGIFVLAIDTSKSDEDRIFGASAVYTIYADRDSGSKIALKEAGSSNVVKEYRGFRLHPIFHWSRALHEFLLDRNGFETYFGAIISPNEISEKNIKKACFTEWASPPPSLVRERMPLAPENHEIKYYRLDPKELVNHAKWLLTAEARGVVSRDLEDGTHETVPITLDLQVLRRYRKALQQLADGDTTTLQLGRK